MKLTDAELRYLRHYWEESLNLVRGPAKRNMPTCNGSSRSALL
jgi:hypothetical protein